MADLSEGVGLAEAIAAIRRDLLAAQDAKSDELNLTVGKVTVELTVSVEKSGGGEASVKVWNVLNLGAKGQYTSGDTNKITVELTPTRPGGGGFDVGSEKSGRPR